MVDSAFAKFCERNGGNLFERQKRFNGLCISLFSFARSSGVAAVLTNRTRVCGGRLAGCTNLHVNIHLSRVRRGVSTAVDCICRRAEAWFKVSSDGVQDVRGGQLRPERLKW